MSLILNAADFSIALSEPALRAEVLADIQCPEPRLLIVGGNGAPQETVRQIDIFKSWSPDGFVIALVGEEDLQPHNLRALFQAGANACLSKIITSEALIKSVELIALGETIVSHQPLWALLRGEREAAPEQSFAPAPSSVMGGRDPAGDKGPTPPLSQQEKRILRCVVEGASNKAIARKFDIAEATVKVHLKAILRKIRLQNRTQAAVWALNNKFDLEDNVPPAEPPRIEVVSTTDAPGPGEPGPGPTWRASPRRSLPGLRRVK